jgi:hypothetical protein
MALLLGSAPNQVPTNGDLGTAAFIDAMQLPVSTAQRTAIDLKANYENPTLLGITRIGELRYNNGYSQSFKQSYGSSSYLLNGEYQPIVTVTPSGSSYNFVLSGTMYVQTGASVQIITFNVGLRSNTLPSLSWDTSYSEELIGGLVFAKPVLWVKASTTAAFQLALLGVNTTHNITVHLDVVNRIYPYSDVVMNTAVSSDVASVPAGYVSYDFDKISTIINERIYYTNAVEAPTATAGDNSGQLATTSYVQTALTVLNASNLTSGTIPDARLTGAYTGLSDLTGSGTVKFTKLHAQSTGSATAPSFSWGLDDNTGMYSPADNEIGFTVASALRLRIASTLIDSGVVIRSPSLITDVITNKSGAALVLNAGESGPQAVAQTDELVYVNAEGGLQINSSPDNWSSGWVNRNTATINDIFGDSYFPGAITATSFVGSAVSETLATITARGAIATGSIGLPTGSGNGFTFWGSSGPAYNITMGNGGSYNYGPVTNYSIKHSVNATLGHGFTWGTSGSAPIAAIEVTTGNMQIAGTFSAKSKSFLIDHPTKPGKTLRYGSLEGPENGVYIRGKTTSNVIELPEYWTKLVDPDSITVSLTAIGKAQNIFVKLVEDNTVHIGGDNINCFYTVFAERVDIAKLQVESD